jgi:tripartite-type tricarboxylate transporter receptor subunit TctC
MRDIAPVAGIGRFPYFMVVNPAFPASNVREFIAYAKANPRKVNMGTGGTGGPDHASGELLQLMTGIQMTHVPYRGTTPALTDLPKIDPRWLRNAFEESFIDRGLTNSDVLRLLERAKWKQ